MKGKDSCCACMCVFCCKKKRRSVRDGKKKKLTKTQLPPSTVPHAESAKCFSHTFFYEAESS